MILPASAGFFDEQYINSVNDLPVIGVTACIVFHETDHIRACIDIVGFRNLSRDNGTFFINGDPERLAIIRNAAYGLAPGIQDSIEKSVSLSQQGENLTASLSVVLKWHTMFCDSAGCFVNGRFEETEVFDDIAPIPARFVGPSNGVVLTKYNGSLYAPAVLAFSDRNVSMIRARTENGSITHYLKSGIVNYTSKGVPFMDIGSVDLWKQEGRGISHVGDEIVLQDGNITSLSFQTPYGAVAANITRISAPSTQVNPGVFGFMFIIASFLGGIYAMAKTVF